MEAEERLRWGSLFRVGSVAALVVVIIYLLEIVVVIFVGLPPITVEGWFAVFQKNRLLGLLQSFTLDIIAACLHVPLYLALYFFLREARKAQTVLVTAVVLSLVGIAIYFSSNVTFSMLYLSDLYSSAASDLSRSQILASGQSMLAIYNGTGAFAASFLYALSGLLASVAMLSSGMFRKSVGIAGIVGNALELGLPPSITPAAVLKLAPLLIGGGGVIMLFWYSGIAVRLWQFDPRGRIAEDKQERSS